MLFRRVAMLCAFSPRAPARGRHGFAIFRVVSRPLSPPKCKLFSFLFLAFSCTGLARRLHQRLTARAARPASPHDRVVAALSVQPTSEKCGSAPEAASPADGTIAPMIECEAGAGAPANRRGRSNVSPKL